MSDREIKVVAEAIDDVLGITSHNEDDCPECILDFQGYIVNDLRESIAQAAIAASDSQYVPMLVLALKKIEYLTRNSKHLPSITYNTIAKKVLATLPEEGR